MKEYTPNQLRLLAEDPNLEAVYLGTTITDQVLYRVNDHSLATDETSITIEAGDHVLVSKHHDGTYFMHFMSYTPNMFHYKAPWISDDQVTHDEGAIYHV